MSARARSDRQSAGIGASDACGVRLHCAEMVRISMRQTVRKLREATRPHLDAGPKPSALWSQLLQAGASVGVEPTTDGTLSRCSYLTELTCWRQRPRPRAVHASAIRSAGAPGGTHEPAPLTRFPSRPLYSPIPFGDSGPNGTRGRSRTCVLWVQSPTGMPATHGSCIGSGGRNRTCVGCVQSAAGMPATHT